MVDSGTLKLVEMVIGLNDQASSSVNHDAQFKKKCDALIGETKRNSDNRKQLLEKEKKEKIDSLNSKYEAFLKDRNENIQALDNVLENLKKVGYDKYIDYSVEIPVAEPSVMQHFNEKIRTINEEGILAFLSRVFFKSRREMVMELYMDVEGCRKFIKREIQNAYRELTEAILGVEKKHQNDIKTIQAKERQTIEASRNSYFSSRNSLSQQSKLATQKASYGEYQKIVKDYYAENGLYPNFWTSYSSPTNYKHRVLLGMGMIDANAAFDNVSIYSSSLPSSCFADGKFKIPVVVDFKKGFNVYVGYNESERDRVLSGINSFLLKTISVTPLKSVSWSVFDPKFNGGSIGSLERFTKVSDGRLGTIVHCKKNEVDERFSYLEDLIRQRNALLSSGPNGGYKDFYDFNNKNKSKKISMHIVTLYDAQYDVYNQYINTIEKIIQDGKRLGISLIALRQKETNPTYGNKRDVYKENLSHLLPIRFENGDFYIRISNRPVLFRFNAIPGNIDNYLNGLYSAFEAKPEIRNDFPHFYNENTKLHTMESTKCLNIPFAITDTGKISYLKLDHNNCAHALIGGVPGSGKSIALLSILNGIVINYAPDDVEVWAIDYGNTTFGKYKAEGQQLPHIKRIITDQSPEFAVDLINELEKLVKERNAEWEKYNTPGKALIDDIELFRHALCEQYGTYKKNPHARRIVILMDEFQFFTKALGDMDAKNPFVSYRNNLERLLKVLRKCGIHFVFSSQDIPSGASGFTPSSEKWIPVRLCLNTNGDATLESLILKTEPSHASEIKTKLLTDMSRLPGTVVYKRPLIAGEPINNNSVVEGGNNIYMRNRIIRIKESEDWSVADKLYERIRKSSNMSTKTEMFVSTERKSIETLKLHPLNIDLPHSEELELFIGEAIGFSNELSLKLTRHNEQNILLVGGKDTIEQSKRESTLIFSILSCVARSDTEVVVFRFDDINIFHSEKLEKILKALNHQHNFNYIVGANHVIDYFGTFDKTSLDRHITKRIFVWLDIENIDLLEQISTMVPIIETNNLDIEPDFGEMDENATILDLIQDSQVARKKISVDIHSGVDKVKKSIKFLSTDGNRHGNWNIVTTDNFSNLNDSKYFNIKQFGHRIGFKMSPDYLAKVFTTTNKITELFTETTSVYQDISESRPIAYRPFIMPTTEWVEKFIRKNSKGGF